MVLLLVASAPLVGCEAQDFFELHPRRPDQQELTCEEVCEDAFGDNDDYHLSSCKDVLDLDDEPAVICHYWESTL